MGQPSMVREAFLCPFVLAGLISPLRIWSNECRIGEKCKREGWDANEVRETECFLRLDRASQLRLKPIRNAGQFAAFVKPTEVCRFSYR